MYKKVIMGGMLTLSLLSACGIENSDTAISASTANEVVTNQQTETKEEEREPGSDITFIGKEYKKGKITVEYPQLSREDGNKAKIINDVITKDATYFFENDLYEGYTGDIKYATTFLSDEVVSFTYQGLMTSPIQSYPVHLFYSTIINLKTGEKETLGDLVTLDETFVQAFREGKILSSSSPEYSNEVKKYISTLSNETLLNEFSQADKMDVASVFTYLTNDAIVVTLGVPHALGDYVQVEMPKKYLK
jgi:hypothetical protein